MTWFGKSLFGSLGTLAGVSTKDLSVVLGNSLAADLAHDTDRHAGQLKVMLGRQEDETGCLLDLLVEERLPSQALVLARLQTGRSGRVRGYAPFSDSDGAFVTFAPIVDGRSRFYLPYGALRTARAGTYQLTVALISGHPLSRQARSHGSVSFPLELPACPRGTKVDYLEPLIHLAMQVAEADGGLERAEVRAVKDFFVGELGLRGEAVDQLRQVMRRDERPPPPALVQAIRFRFPTMRRSTLLEFLVAIARSDGDVHPAELQLIRAVADLLEVPPDEQPDLRDVANPTPAGHWAVLGLSPGATLAQVKAAYRALVQGYHPDRVAGLPQEFADLAHQKMVAINAAYQAVLAQLRRPARTFRQSGVHVVQTAIEVRFANGEAQRYYIDPGAKVVIGRDAAADIVIPDQHVSRRHAELSVGTHQQVVLVDLASANGVHVDGQRVYVHRLEPGQVARLGGANLRLLSPSSRRR